jgi:hypothetical protein
MPFDHFHFHEICNEGYVNSRNNCNFVNKTLKRTGIPSSTCKTASIIAPAFLGFYSHRCTAVIREVYFRRFLKLNSHSHVKKSITATHISYKVPKVSWPSNLGTAGFRVDEKLCKFWWFFIGNMSDTLYCLCCGKYICKNFVLTRSIEDNERFKASRSLQPEFIVSGLLLPFILDGVEVVTEFQILNYIQKGNSR